MLTLMTLLCLSMFSISDCFIAHCFIIRPSFWSSIIAILPNILFLSFILCCSIVVKKFFFNTFILVFRCSHWLKHVSFLVFFVYDVTWFLTFIIITCVMLFHFVLRTRDSNLNFACISFLAIVTL